MEYAYRPKISLSYGSQIEEVANWCTGFSHCTSLIKKDQNPHQKLIDQKAFQIEVEEKKDHQIRKHARYDTHFYAIYMPKILLYIKILRIYQVMNEKLILISGHPSMI